MVSAPRAWCALVGAGVKSRPKRIITTTNLPRWKIFDCILPFWSDRNLRWFYGRYKYERPDQIARKREVCRKAVLKGHRVDSFKRKQEVLWFIDVKAEKRRRRREFREEFFGWLTLPGLIGGALAGAWAVWQFLQQHVLTAPPPS